MAKLLVEKKEKAIMGVPNLMSEIRSIANSSPAGHVLYRGVQDYKEHKLIPSIGREHWFAGRAVTFNAKCCRLSR